MIKGIILTLPMLVTFFWGVTLFLDSGKKDRAKFVLAIFMGLSSLLYAAHAAFFSFDYNLYVMLDIPYTLSSLSVFPLFYLYIRTLAKEEMPNRRVYWIFAPAIFFASSSLILISLMSSQDIYAYIHNHIYKESIEHNFSTVGKIHVILNIASRVVFALQLIPSVYFSWKLISEYEQKIRNYYSSIDERSLGWTGNMMMAMVSIAVFSIIVNILGKAFFLKEISLLIVPSLLFGALLYMIGYLGFKQRFSIVHYHGDLSKEGALSHRNSTESTKSKLHEELVTLLNQTHIYRNTDLRITDVAKALKTNRSYISNIVNSEFNCTFSEFINRYRVEFSKGLLLDKRGFVLEYVAEESGFASVNSYLRAFRKETGTTPGNFRSINKEDPAI